MIALTQSSLLIYSINLGREYPGESGPSNVRPWPQQYQSFASSDLELANLTSFVEYKAVSPLETFIVFSPSQACQALVFA